MAGRFGWGCVGRGSRRFGRAGWVRCLAAEGRAEVAWAARAWVGGRTAGGGGGGVGWRPPEQGGGGGGCWFGGVVLFFFFFFYKWFKFFFLYKCCRING